MQSRTEMPEKNLQYYFDNLCKVFPQDNLVNPPPHEQYAHRDDAIRAAVQHKIGFHEQVRNDYELIRIFQSTWMSVLLYWFVAPTEENAAENVDPEIHEHIGKMIYLCAMFSFGFPLALTVTSRITHALTSDLLNQCMQWLKLAYAPWLWLMADRQEADLIGNQINQHLDQRLTVQPKNSSKLLLLRALNNPQHHHDLVYRLHALTLIAITLITWNVTTDALIDMKLNDLLPTDDNLFNVLCTWPKIIILGPLYMIASDINLFYIIATGWANELVNMHQIPENPLGYLQVNTKIRWQHLLHCCTQPTLCLVQYFHQIFLPMAAFIGVRIYPSLIDTAIQFIDILSEATYMGIKGIDVVLDTPTANIWKAHLPPLFYSTPLTTCLIKFCNAVGLDDHNALLKANRAFGYNKLAIEQQCPRTCHPLLSIDHQMGRSLLSAQIGTQIDENDCTNLSILFLLSLINNHKIDNINSIRRVTCLFENDTSHQYLEVQQDNQAYIWDLWYQTLSLAENCDATNNPLTQSQTTQSHDVSFDKPTLSRLSPQIRAFNLRFNHKITEIEPHQARYIR